MDMINVEMYTIWRPGMLYKELYTWIEYEDGHETRYSSTLN